MADRLETGYRAKLRWLLAKVRPRRLDFGVDLLVRRARALSEREGVPLPEALARVYEFTRWRVKKRLERTAACRLTGQPLDAPVRPPRFLCDPSLGGLARWLVLVGAINAAIGAYYYLRIIGVMYLRGALKPLARPGVGPGVAAVWACAVLTLWLGITPSAMLRLAEAATMPVEVKR